jgi:two-component system chemotaxis sensor kinase CheA
MDDDILKSFIDESFEHLADIEGDLLAIEQGGADIDMDLVNKVYRAAHSIKGGAGFMDLTVIKELTHEMENVLGKVRGIELIPTPELVGALLSAADTLKALLSDIENSNEADISGHLAELQAIADAPPAPAQSPRYPEEPFAAEEPATEEEPPPPPPLPVGENSFSAARRGGRHIYQIQADIVDDIEIKGNTLSHFIGEALSVGEILQSGITVNTSSGPVSTGDHQKFSLLFSMIFATIIEPGDVNMIFNLPESRITPLEDDFVLKIPDADPARTTHPATPYSTPASVETTPDIEEPETAIKAAPAPFAKAAPREPKPADPGAVAAGDSTVRVQVNMLEMLMNLAGELVLGRNQLLQAILSHDTRLIEMSGQRMDRITTSLQEAIMLTRMQPVGIVFNKFPRVVRDLSRKLGKEVELRVEGREVELDKTIIEAISDPLTHLVRNAVDHGIESPEVRTRAGKPAGGTIELRAFHAAGQVNIEVSDDGKGLHGDKLVASAIAKGVITEPQARLMSDNEKMNLIFLPGFSTAQTVSDVSGRGVGMDVVRTNIEKIGGHVLIDSHPGEGTSIQIKLPLTLAIIPCQIVVVMEERFAIPQVNLLELLRITPDKLKERIDVIGNAEVLRLRDELLPLVRLADVIGLERKYRDQNQRKLTPEKRTSIADRRSRRIDSTAEGDCPEPASDDNDNRKTPDRRYHADSSMNIAVVASATMKYGLIVDQLLDAEEIVVKPLSRHLKGYNGYAGATIMGDGRVSLILDVTGISQMAQLNFVQDKKRAAEDAMIKTRAEGDKQSLLIFWSAEKEQFASPLGLVRRIEKIKRTQVEHVGGRRVMQYKGGSLPLFSLDEAANVGPLADVEDLLVIVFFIANREIGLLASGPVDAVEIRVAFDNLIMKQTGIMGSAIIAGHTTLLVDIYGLASALIPEWFSGQKEETSPDKPPITILYSEDSRFFRTQVKGFMEEEGFRVIEAEDGEIAWNLLQQHKDEISLVVTDIEMPNLDGYGLAQRIKSSAEYARFPVIALTTLAGEDNQAKGRALGIDDYNIKLDRENLLASISRQLKRIGQDLR